MHVLIPEEDRDIAEIGVFGVRLALPHADVMIAASGAKALACFAEQRPDLVVLDIAMPPLDGFGVLREIRVRSQLSVRDAEADQARAERWGPMPT